MNENVQKEGEERLQVPIGVDENDGDDKFDLDLRIDEKEGGEVEQGPEEEYTNEEIRQQKFHMKQVLYFDPELPIVNQVLNENSKHKSKTNLSEEEKIEIEMFKQTRVDPYYEHYLKDSLTYYASKTGDLTRSVGMDLPFMVAPSDMVTGDKIRPEKLKQFKYNIRERFNKSDGKKHMTTAKTKRARAM